MELLSKLEEGKSTFKPKDKIAKIKEALIVAGSPPTWNKAQSSMLLRIVSLGIENYVAFWHKREERINEPLSSVHLLFTIMSMFPANFAQAGFTNGIRDKEFANKAALITTCITSSLGGRVGDFLPPRPGTDKPLTREEVIRVPKLSNLTFFEESFQETTLGNISSPRAQGIFLDKVLKSEKIFASIIALCNKSKRLQVILLTHFHIYGSCVLCPLCTIAIALMHRLLFLKKRIKSAAPLFGVYSRKSGITPLPQQPLRDVLERVCTQNEWHILRPHDAKRGLLTSCWYMSTQFFLPDRVLHQLGSHKPDYTRKYLHPRLIETYKEVSKARRKELDMYVQSLEPHLRDKLIKRIKYYYYPHDNRYHLSSVVFSPRSQRIPQVRAPPHRRPPLGASRAERPKMKPPPTQQHQAIRGRKPVRGATRGQERGIME